MYLWWRPGCEKGQLYAGTSSSNSTLKCFRCCEIGHRQSECKKADKRALFVDTYDGDEEDVIIVGQPIFDDEEAVNDEVVGEILRLY
ncbi:conserved hypothetical protein [Ricinus communis]|uniref:CCHC-type domain-containing protein n=1 Tax=Ricinus communis TaxID=3988 RepID=B9SU70_RICCO|nr:conserved hypothetical protein [Ricinus communis]